MLLRAFLLFIIINKVALCQPADLALPALGYVLDSDRGGQIRPITGLPGAALVGPPLGLGFSAMRLATSSRGTLAMASTPTGDLMLVRDGEARTFDQAAGTASFALSPSGKAAVSSRGSEPVSVKIWDHLELLVPTAEWTLPWPCPSPQLAISDNGRRAVATCAGASTLMWTDGQPQSAPVNLAGFSFLPESLAGAGVDSAGDLFWLDESGQWSLLHPRWADAGAGNLAVLATKRWVLAVSGQTILRFDRDTSESERFVCSCPVTGLHPTPVNGLVRLTQAAGPAAVHLFDAGPGRFWFVPSAEASQ